MASGLEKAFTYEERQNYIRLKSLVSLSTYVLKAMFDHTFPPEQLHCKLKQIIGTIIHGRKKNIISLKQYDLLFPQTSPPQSDKFDVSLLVYLLRHICGLDSRCKWWEEHDNSKIPDTVLGEEADIARIRNIQNEIHHLQGASMKQSEFDAKWAITEQAMLRLGTIYNLLGLKNEIETLKNKPFETVMEKTFVIMQSHGFDEEYWYDDKYDYDSETYDIENRYDGDFDVADAYDDDNYDEYNEYVPDFDDENGCDSDDEPVYYDCRHDNDVDYNDEELVCDVDLFENIGYYDNGEPVYDEDRYDNRDDYKNVEPVWDENRYDNAGDNKSGKPVRDDARYKHNDGFAELVCDDDCYENYDDSAYAALVCDDDCSENYDDEEYAELVWEDDCYENCDDDEYTEPVWEDDCYGNCDDDEYTEPEWDEDSYESDDYYDHD